MVSLCPKAHLELGVAIQSLKVVTLVSNKLDKEQEDIIKLLLQNGAKPNFVLMKKVRVYLDKINNTKIHGKLTDSKCSKGCKDIFFSTILRIGNEDLIIKAIKK